VWSYYHGKSPHFFSWILKVGREWLSDFDEDVALHKIYRYLDRLHSTQQDRIQQISVEHTRKILGGKIGLVFYDVTTLYVGNKKTQNNSKIVQRKILETNLG
jgi:hypothetical protein